ncbi:MAG: Gfo/Idh/MocA family protein [Limisphaerales bacterium]
MNNSLQAPASRRDFLKNTGRFAAGATLAGLTLPHVHAAEDNTIRLALIGCGGRGCGAAANAFDSPQGPVKMMAMADLFEDRLASGYQTLSEKYRDKMEAPPDRRFSGFDAWRKAIDCLRPGDVAMLCGYSAWRPLQLEYAVAKGVNVFMEKSFAPDVPGLRRIMKAGEDAARKNLKIASGLMCRHAPSRQELVRRIHDGELGEVLLIRGYRMQPVAALPKRPPQEDELTWQIRHFTDFLWVSGGWFAEMNIHQIDEFCWIKDAYPISAHGVGGRSGGRNDCGQTLDSMAVEWTFADGTKATHVIRWLANCFADCTTFVHGAKCMAQFPGSAHPGPVSIHRDQRAAPDNLAWRAKPDAFSAWQSEWDVLLEAIRQDKPHNEAKRAALSNLADLMGRAAVHSGKVITWEEAMGSDFQFCPDIDRLTAQSAPPVQADDQGRYPVPMPGKWVEI